MWYYAENSEQRGPVTKEDLVAKLQSGERTRDTIVWTNNMRNWEKASDVQELAEFLPAAAPEPTPAPAPVFPQETQQAAPQSSAEADVDDGSSGDSETIKLRPVGTGVGEGTVNANPYQPTNAPQVSVATAPQAGMLTCQQCGKPVHPSQALNYQGTIVCPDCKQQFLHDLYERHGTNNSYADYPAASFWQRVGAHIIDSIIMTIASQTVSFVLGMMIGIASGVLGAGDEAASVLGMLSSFSVQLVIFLLYETLFICKFAATPGKMVLGLKVLHNGENLSVGRAIGRALGKQLSGIICYIGYLMAAFSEDTKALHDIMCDTVVVSTK